MGLSPEQLAGLTPFDFDLKCQGFKDGQAMTEVNFRKLAWITFAVNADPKSAKGMTINDVWPVEGKHVKRRALYSKKEITKMLKSFQNRKTIR